MEKPITTLAIQHCMLTLYGLLGSKSLEPNRKIGDGDGFSGLGLAVGGREALQFQPMTY